MGASVSFLGGTLPARCSHRTISRSQILSTLRALPNAPLRHRLAREGQLLDAMVVIIGHIDVALGVHRHTGWPAKLAGRLTLGAPLGQRLPGPGELLDPLIGGVGYIHVALAIDRDAGGPPELAGAVP